MNFKAKEFQNKIYTFYKNYGRHHLPWRHSTDPYCILVSECMLQQTQVDRVIPKYEAFIKRFPTVKSLAKASLPEVLQLWSGLGYNRRARMLYNAAQEIVVANKFPTDLEELQTLSGVGPYTASAILAFAYNKPVIMIETNIRTVFIHEFLNGKSNITDTKIKEYIQHTLDTENPREWYAALMDYGAYLKKKYPNPSRKSAHHTIQKPFKGSLREVRGHILKELCSRSVHADEFMKSNFPKDKIQKALRDLEKDKLIIHHNGMWEIGTK